MNNCKLKFICNGSLDCIYQVHNEDSIASYENLCHNEEANKNAYEKYLEENTIKEVK